MGVKDREEDEMKRKRMLGRKGEEEEGDQLGLLMTFESYQSVFQSVYYLNNANFICIIISFFFVSYHQFIMPM